MASQITDENIAIDKLKAEVEKLRAETANLRNVWLRFVPVFTGIVAISVFGFSVIQYTCQQRTLHDQEVNQRNAQLEQQKSQQKESQENFNRNVQLSEKEFRRKFYEKQLEVYMDLSKTAAQISTSNDKIKLHEAYRHFLEVYNGNFMVVVENAEVKKAVDNYIKVADQYEKNPIDNTELQELAKKLSLTLRRSFVQFWGVPFKEEIPIDMEDTNSNR